MSLRNSVISYIIYDSVFPPQSKSYIIHVSVFSPPRILIGFQWLLCIHHYLLNTRDKITQACGKNFLIFNFFYFYREVYFSSPYTILKLVLLYLVGYIIVKKCNLEREKQNQFSGNSLKGGLCGAKDLFGNLPLIFEIFPLFRALYKHNRHINHILCFQC